MIEPYVTADVVYEDARELVEMLMALGLLDNGDNDCRNAFSRFITNHGDSLDDVEAWPILMDWARRRYSKEIEEARGAA